MNNRFDGITRVAPVNEVKSKEPKRIGRDVYDALMELLVEETERPTTPLGTFVANSTKREIRARINVLFRP